jgi:predicted lipoprotein with Yx(FWY)xxD motif
MRTSEGSLAVRPAVTARWLVAVGAALTLLASLLAFPTTGHTAPAKGQVVSTTTTSLGRILTNSSGRTLYLFLADKNGKSACSGQCATAWPPLIASGKASAGPGTKASLLGTTKRADGRLQVTYDHHPLYTFIKDTKRGQTSGEGVNAFGAVWDAVSPSGAKVVAKSPAASSQSTPSTPSYSP